MKKVIWFMRGYSNLLNAINDLKNADKNNQFTIICSHSNPGFVGFESSDHNEVEPKCNDNEFLDYCEEIIKKYKVDVIFATHRQVSLEKNRNRFRKIGATVVTAATHKTIISINDKAKLYHLLGGGPVKIPMHGVFNDIYSFNEQYKKIKKEFSEVCMKPTHGVYGLGFYILKDKADDLSLFLNQEQKVSVKQFRKNIGTQKFKEMILMQYLEGAERSVDCVAYNGTLVGGTIRRKSSSGIPQLIESNDEVMEQVRWITKKLKLNGIFNIQFKDFEGIPYLLEINTRLSGKSFYSTLAGFNIPYVASLLFSGLKTVNEIKYDTVENLYISSANYPVIAKQYKKFIDK